MYKRCFIFIKIKHSNTHKLLTLLSQLNRDLRYVKLHLFIYCFYNTFSIFCTFNHSNAFKMENDNRVCRLGGIRRIFDKPPPRLLKIHFVQFLQLWRYNCFPHFYAFTFPPFLRGYFSIYI